MSNAVEDPPRSDAGARLAYLDRIAPLLWPGAQRVRSRGPARHPGELLVAPAARMPRVLLPAGNARAAARTVLAEGSGGRRAWAQRQAIGAVARVGLAPWLMPHRLRPDPATPSIVDHLADILGRPVTVSTALTVERANRKPVLHALDERGDSIAWVKVGIDDLTNTLVAGEATALAGLHSTARLRIPQVLHSGEWHGLQVLALSPLPAAGASRPEQEALTTAMQDLAGGEAEVGEAYAAVLAQRAATLTGSVGEQDAVTLTRLQPLLDALLAATRRTPLPAGTWHGDWTPWNCAERDGAVLVWDWERCAPLVPRGFDALHYRMQDALVTHGTAHRDAAVRCIADAPQTLSGWTVDAAAARMTAALYLVEIALRYIADDQRAAAGFGGDVETWILPALLDYYPRVLKSTDNRPTRG